MEQLQAQSQAMGSQQSQSRQVISSGYRSMNQAQQQPGNSTHHTKNQHSYNSQHRSSTTNQVKQRSTNSNFAGGSQGNMAASGEKDSRRNQQVGNTAAPSAQSRQQEQFSSEKKLSGNRHSRVNSMSKGYSVKIPSLSLENSFKRNRPITECQTAQQSLQSTTMNQYVDGSANAGGPQRLISEVIGGNELSPISGELLAKENEKSGVVVMGSDEAKKQQMRQMKNLQKLQKSGQSRKKSNQFGKSNKILLMSGTKSKLMEMSAASATIDKSALKASGAISKGTATLIELRQVMQGVPDQMKIGNGPEGASQTYNNASKLLASANEIDLSDKNDYGGYNQTNGHSKGAEKMKPTISREGSQLMMTMGNFESEDGELQAPDGVPMTSVFDQVEEMQFMSYELGTKLRSLVDILIQNSAVDQHYMMNGGHSLVLQTDTWDQIGNVAREATTDFELIQESLRSFFDRMQDEVAKWKRRCSRLHTKLQTVVVSRVAADQKSGVPPKPMGVSKSLGRHAKNQEKSSRITVSGNGGRKGQFKQSNSLNHSGVQSKKERLMLQKSLIEIVNVYDKNRTQIYSNLEEMESRVNQFKNTREKLSVQHLGTMTTVEQEMEQLCLRSARSHKSNQNMKSHRSHSASKRPMTSLEASRRSSRPDHPSDHMQSQHRTSDRKDAVMNTPKIINSKPKAQSSGVRSPVNKPQSLVPPLPIHMIKDLNSKEQQRPKKNQGHHQQNSARSAHSKPPPPESYRSHRSQNRGMPQTQQDSHRSAGGGGNNGGVSRRSGKNSYRDSLGGSSAQNITGAIVNGALVNGVMLQANTKIATSKFDKDLEADFEGDEATLLFDTERLKQFPEDYACLEAMDATDQKILVKQWLFMKYERELKQQAKVEKDIKEQKKRERQALQKQNPNGKKRQNSQGSNFNTSNQSYRSSTNRNGSKDVQLGQILDISAIQLESSLSEIGTIEGLKARQEERNYLQEAKISEMMDMDISQNISGLKTVTEKELVLIAEKQWQQYEQLKKEDRKVLPWVANDEESNCEARSEAANQKILADLSVDEHRKNQHESVPISPSHIQMQLNVGGKSMNSVHHNSVAHQPATHLTSYDSNTHQQQQNQAAHQLQKSFTNSSHQPTDGEQEPSPIKPVDYSQLPPGESFYNDSSLVEDFENLTPQQVRSMGNLPVNIGDQQQQMAPGRQPMKTMLTLEQAQVVNYNGGNSMGQLPQQSSMLMQQSNVAVAYNHPSSINAVANATSNSEESSFLIANQKKSLEMITERESEFSNTMGTYARPSQRSKQSKAPSSGAKYNGTRGQTSSALVNGSNASLNNSSVQINSSRQKKQMLVGSFADMSVGENNFVDQIHEESKSSIGGGTTSGAAGTGGRLSASKNQSSTQQKSSAGKLINSNGAASQVGYRNHPGDNQTEVKTTVLQQSKKQRVDSSSIQQFTDLATQTPMLQIGAVNASAGRKQTLNESNSNVTKSQIAYHHLMHELKVGPQVSAASGSDMPHHQRQRQHHQSSVVDLGGSEMATSYGAETSYIDESLASSSDVGPNGLSSVKKHRKQRHIGGSGLAGHHINGGASNHLVHNQQASTSLSLKRSNSEVYIKDTSMQNQDDALFVPIMYAMEASMTLQQSAENGKVRIDHSQLNNLTRYLEANNSARRFGNGPDSNGTFQINNTLYNQLQKLFMQHHTQQQTALQDFTSANNISLSKSVGKGGARSQQIGGGASTGNVEQPGILKQAAFGITSLLNESLQQPQLQKRTIQMLQHLQGYTKHNINSAVGLIFSNSQQQAATSGGMQRMKGLSPSTDHNTYLTNSLLKRINSPIVDHFINAPLNKSEVKKSLLEGLKLIKLQESSAKQRQNTDSRHGEASNLYDNQGPAGQDEDTTTKYKTEIAPKNKLQVGGAAHTRGLSKEIVSSYIHQVKRPVTNLSNRHQSNLSSGGGGADPKSSHQTIANVHSTGISSANVKTGGKQMNQQMLQKSLLAYQSTEFNPRGEQRSDYVDQSIISQSVLGGVPSSSHSSGMVSKSVERISGTNDSQVSVQSNLQRKLRLKTNKQLKIISERGGVNKPRPASSMATNSSAIQHSMVSHQTNESGEGGRQTVHGVMNLSTISAKPQSQFKILQFSSVGKKSGSSTRDQSSGSGNGGGKQRHLQLQSQPQLTKQQQLQLQLQQKSLASQLGAVSSGGGGNYGNTNSNGSATLESNAAVNQKGPVLKRINIKKNPSIKRQVDNAKQQALKQQQQQLHQ